MLTNIVLHVLAQAQRLFVQQPDVGSDSMDFTRKNVLRTDRHVRVPALVARARTSNFLLNLGKNQYSLTPPDANQADCFDLSKINDSVRRQDNFT